MDRNIHVHGSRGSPNEREEKPMKMLRRGAG